MVEHAGCRGRDTLCAFAEINAETFRRSAALLAVASSAAEAARALAALQTRSHEHRLQHCSTVAQRLVDDDWLDPATTAAAATDTFYVLAGPETYLVLREQRRLSHAEYVDWLTHMLVGALSA